MKYVITTLVLLTALAVAGQNAKYVNLALVSTQTDYPFGKLAALVGQPRHPGIEIGYGNILNQKSKREWFVEMRLGYFFHRYVQHGIPITANFGYRYHLGKRFNLYAALGGGYMQSIPATGKFKLDENGDYRRNKGAGRMHAIANLSLGAGYVLKPGVKMPYTLFTRYEQRLQFPFIRSYVPLLPYNSFHLGIQRPIFKNRHPKNSLQ